MSKGLQGDNLIAINLAPPFKKDKESSNFTMKLPRENMTLKDLALYINKTHSSSLKVNLLDDKGFLLASFMVNGKHAPPKQVVNEGDVIVIYKRIGGG